MRTPVAATVSLVCCDYKSVYLSICGVYGLSLCYPPRLLPLSHKLLVCCAYMSIYLSIYLWCLWSVFKPLAHPSCCHCLTRVLCLQICLSIYLWCLWGVFKPLAHSGCCHCLTSVLCLQICLSIYLSICGVCGVCLYPLRTPVAATIPLSLCLSLSTNAGQRVAESMRR